MERVIQEMKENPKTKGDEDEGEEKDEDEEEEEGEDEDEEEEEGEEEDEDEGEDEDEDDEDDKDEDDGEGIFEENNEDDKSVDEAEVDEDIENGLQEDEEEKDDEMEGKKEKEEKEENNKDFKESNDSNDHHDVSHSDIGQSLPTENTTSGSTIAKRVAKVPQKRMPKKFGEFIATINKRITQKKEGTSNVPIVELSSEVHEAFASSQMGLCVETMTVKRDGIYFVHTTSQVILERSRDYWWFDVLTPEDRNVIDAFLQLLIAKSGVLWSTLEFELLALDLHDLLFGKHLIDRTIHAWLVYMKQRSNITIW